MRILIVENDAIIGVSLEDELTKAGHLVIGPVASSGAAWLLATSTQPKLAIIDLESSSAQELASFARRLKGELGIQSLFLTFEPERAMANSGFAMGLLAKPFDFADIAAVVDVAAAVLMGSNPPPPVVPWALTLCRPSAASDSAIA